MVASTDIKFFVHSNNNAPQLQNAYGSMIGVLDACLVNGISLGSVSTLTAVGTMVTAVFSAAHNLMQYQVLKITGANQAEYNGEHRILTVPNATSVTFELGSAPSATTATGTITASLPPLGWEKPFSSTNEAGGGKAAYRSKNVLLPSRPFLRVVDELDPAWSATYAKYAKVGIVEEMTGIDTMLGAQAPYDSANPNKNWTGTGSGATAVNGWAKWYYAKASRIDQTGADSIAPANATRKWLIVGNSDYFYILNIVNPDDYLMQVQGFGSFKSLLSADNSANFLAACINYSAASSSYLKTAYIGLGGNAVNQYILLQRNHSQGGYTEAKNCSFNVGLSVQYSGVDNYVGVSDLSGNSVYTPVFINEGVLRGEHYGVFWLHQRQPYPDMQLVYNGGRYLIAVNAATAAASSLPGQIFLQVGGDL